MTRERKRISTLLRRVARRHGDDRHGRGRLQRPDRPPAEGETRIRQAAGAESTACGDTLRATSQRAARYWEAIHSPSLPRERLAPLCEV